MPCACSCPPASGARRGHRPRLEFGLGRKGSDKIKSPALPFRWRGINPDNAWRLGKVPAKVAEVALGGTAAMVGDRHRFGRASSASGARVAGREVSQPLVGPVGRMGEGWGVSLPVPGPGGPPVGWCSR